MADPTTSTGKLTGGALSARITLSGRIQDGSGIAVTPTGLVITDPAGRVVHRLDVPPSPPHTPGPPPENDEPCCCCCDGNC